MEAIQAEIISLVTVLLTALAGYLTKQVTTFLKEKGANEKLEQHKSLIRIVVGAVEQMYKEVDGSQKFDKAKHDVIELLNEKGIQLSDKQLDLMIENVVKEMNDKKNNVIKVDQPKPEFKSVSADEFSKE